MRDYPGLNPEIIACMTPTQQNALLNPEYNPDDDSITFPSYAEYAKWRTSHRSNSA